MRLIACIVDDRVTSGLLISCCIAISSTRYGTRPVVDVTVYSWLLQLLLWSGCLKICANEDKKVKSEWKRRRWTTHWALWGKKPKAHWQMDSRVAMTSASACSLGSLSCFNPLPFPGQRNNWCTYSKVFFKKSSRLLFVRDRRPTRGALNKNVPLLKHSAACKFTLGVFRNSRARRGTFTL